jgi:hypothetical protein
MAEFAGDDEVPSLRNAVDELPDTSGVIGKGRPPRPSAIVSEKKPMHADTPVGPAAEELRQYRLAGLKLAAVPEAQDELLTCAEIEWPHVGIEYLDERGPLAEILGKTPTP